MNAFLFTVLREKKLQGSVQQANDVVGLSSANGGPDEGVRVGDNVGGEEGGIVGAHHRGRSHTRGNAKRGPDVGVQRRQLGGRRAADDCWKKRGEKVLEQKVNNNKMLLTGKGQIGGQNRSQAIAHAGDGHDGLRRGPLLNLRGQVQRFSGALVRRADVHVNMGDAVLLAESVANFVGVLFVGGRAHDDGHRGRVLRPGDGLGNEPAEEGLGALGDHRKVLLHQTERIGVNGRVVHVSVDLLVQHQPLLAVWPQAPAVIVDDVGDDNGADAILLCHPKLDLHVNQRVIHSLPGPLQHLKDQAGDGEHLLNVLGGDQQAADVQLRPNERLLRPEGIVVGVVLEKGLQLQRCKAVALLDVRVAFQVGPGSDPTTDPLDGDHLALLRDEALLVVGIRFGDSTDKVRPDAHCIQVLEDGAVCLRREDRLALDDVRLDAVAGGDAILVQDVHVTGVLGPLQPVHLLRLPFDDQGADVGRSNF